MATFAQLRELDTETFRRAASGYSRLADTTALNADTVEAASRDLASWTGDAGAAATRKLDDFSSTFDQTHERLSELDRALADHASKMEQHQRRLANVVIDITSNRRGQLTIDLRTGQIGVVVDHEDGGIDRRLVAEHREHLAQQFADEIRRILGDATEADADTARRRAWRTGCGSLSPRVSSRRRSRRSLRRCASGSRASTRSATASRPPAWDRNGCT